MATTTNFGWTTPNDTDLVKDGAAAIRTLGNGVDTSFVKLKGGTTGQILAKASNTDLDYVWSAAASSKVVQIVAATYNTAASIGATTTTADTGLSATITPTSASNKILILVDQNGVGKSDQNTYCQTRLVATSTFLFNSLGRTDTTVNLTGFTSSFAYLDSPATTSPKTYKTTFQNANGVGTVYVQREGVYSSMILIEVTP